MFKNHTKENVPLDRNQTSFHQGNNFQAKCDLSIRTWKAIMIKK